MCQGLPLIIFDTDMDTDCDDAGAFAMLLNAHRVGKIKLLGVITDSVCDYSAPCCEYIANYYGISVPIGTIYSDFCKDSERFAPYREHTKSCFNNGQGYNAIFSSEIKKIDRDYPSAVSVYRRLLSTAPDNSVTVLCVGMLTAISETLLSNADEISPLTGIELFKSKVKRVITMGNPHKVGDFNWGMDAEASAVFFEKCPSDIYISPEGTSVITGAHLSDELDKNHPLRRAYEIWLGKENAGRSSWDLIASLFAINENAPYLTTQYLGGIYYDKKNKVFKVDENSNKSYKIIKISCDNKVLENYLNDYMMGKIK